MMNLSIREIPFWTQNCPSSQSVTITRDGGHRLTIYRACRIKCNCSYYPPIWPVSDLYLHSKLKQHINIRTHLIL